MTNNENYAKLTTIHYELKEGTKTVYQELYREEKLIDQEWYNNCVDASPFFRNLGGSERQEKEYTSKGYKVTQITSKSPDRQKKTVRIFDLDI